MKDLKDCPIINLEIGDEVVFSPTDYFNYKRNVEGQNIPNIPPDCIICFEKAFIKYAEQHLGIEKINWFRKEFELYKLKNNDIIIVNINYGAALSAIALEELIALGVKQVIVLGSAGTLQETIPLTSLVIAESAIREEGVSYHYLKPSKYVNCSKQLTEKAKKIIQKTKINNVFFGTTWTTDSFYRETLSKTKRYKAENVLSVDMETAALYAVAKYRGVDILSIFYISDSIAKLRWNPDFHKTNSEEIQLVMIDLAIKIVS
jgi:uridine phosphorylase